jgi:hypothetical protein
MVVWPEKALELFMSEYELMAPKWCKSKAEEMESPPAGLFQLAGGTFVLFSLFLIYWQFW